MMAFAAKHVDSTNEVVLNTPSRRPSALFYLPDRLIPRAQAGRKSVVEAVGTKPTLRPGSAQLPEAPYLLIAPLTEKAMLLKSFSGEAIGENQRFVAVQVGD
jgi:hypothetical protein